MATASLVGHSPRGETEDVEKPESESLGETRFEAMLFVGGDALRVSADLLPKRRPPVVGLFPDVKIKR